jgi:hypothetical protein
LTIARRRRGVGVELPRASLDRRLIDFRQWRRTKMFEHTFDEPTVTAVPQIAQSCFGEGRGSGTTVDGRLEDFGFALSADFLGDASVTSLSAFFNAISLTVPRRTQWGDFGRRTSLSMVGPRRVRERLRARK